MKVRAITTLILSLAFVGSATAQQEHPPSDTSIAFDNLTGVLTDGLADGGLQNIIAPGGDAISNFLTTAVVDTGDDINPAGGLELLNALGGFGAAQGSDTADVSNTGTLPGL